MPPFSFLKSSRRNSQQMARNDSSVQPAHDAPEKVQRRQSKRDYFRSLLRISSESRTNRRRSSQLAMPEQPTSPINKPLPPPPPPGTETEPVKAPIKLERIMSPIALPDLHKIFSGAPQFFARSEGHHTGAPHPSVAFPWDTNLEIRDLSDHIQIQDEAWGCVTAWPHITVQVSRNAEATKIHHEKCRAHFLPRCRERPNMLSMQGIERGTMGYQAALEIGVADALEIPNEDSDSSPEAISEHRKKFLNGKDGLRPITDSTLIDRLLSVSEVYHEDPLKHRRLNVQLYTEIFTQLLFPPSRVTDSDDPYSLQVQIEALIKVLAAPMVWVDFTLVEWRIRLGQILWGTPTDPEGDEIAINNEVIYEPGTQKYWLLLQILLSCELLVRLDAISMNIDHGLEAPKLSEIHKFDKNATTSVRWSMLLARAWLENIRVEKLDHDAVPEAKPAGWLATLTGGAHTETITKDELAEVRFHGRHQARQLSGLLHFARKMAWPGLDEITTKVSSDGIKITDSIHGTPIGTPLSMSTNRSSSYFSNRRPKVRRGLSLHRNISAIIHPAGWLSNSYISGLILPGEALGHFLISTLLEHDLSAVSRLGEEANLYGGFIYSGRSFWSTACIIGRVLAAKKGATECMGWISSDVVPNGASEGWVDVDVDTDIQDDPDKKGPKPRLWQKQAVERDGDVIGGADISSVLPGDFVLPSDESVQQPLSVILESLDLDLIDSVRDSPTEEDPTPLTDASDMPAIRTYSASMRFMVEIDGEKKKEVNISLSHDVHFVTAHPCVSSPHTEILKSPMSPSFQPLEQTPASQATSPEPPKGHPLHKAFTYTKIPLSSLLSLPASTPFSSLLSSSLSPPSTSRAQSPIPSPFDQTIHSTTHTTSSTIPKVLVIDCTDQTMDLSAFPQRPMPSPHAPHPKRRGFGSDLEALARGVCAERGWNALVSRRGRGCLGCAIREAGALGWRVVLRVA
ncbi:uncharacterized protein PAC_01492 [Phialocephala subalpina]|uniref:Uncharacterized protein n=1 Tax=Phialocephala subalpina TaxID=576137 RepID=A0A1L7WFR6_9HELO|nr:uncharacterized protein PAC_01492 [Phialocephala subalpina]